MSAFQFLGLVTALVIIPVTFLLPLWTRKEENGFHWLLKAAFLCTVTWYRFVLLQSMRGLRSSR